jgi:predicted AAA+ superfamily ATPase
MAADRRLIDRLALVELDIRLARFPAVALLGPRQVGKTTLALQLPGAAARPTAASCCWDRPRWT